MKAMVESVITQLPVDELEIHPVNRKIYVDDPKRKAALLESIREHGILEPLVVMPQNGKYVVLSGARRLECAKELGYDKVPCIITVVDNPILAVIEHNKYRVKTPVEIYNEAQMLRKILEPKAKERQLSGLKQFQNRPVKPDRTAPIDTRKIIAEKLNVSTGYLSMLEQVMKNRDKIPDVVKRLEEGRETVYSAYRQLKAKTAKEVEIPGIFIGWYFSGKQWLVKDIIARLPPHHCYVEPFGGLCSVLLNKPPSKVEVYNDISRDVVNLLICLKEYPLELISELSLMPYSRWMYEQLIGILDEPFTIPDVERAARWYYLNESTFAGLHGKTGTGSWGHGVKKNYAAMFRRRFGMLLACSKRLLNVLIENRSYEYILEKYDSPDTFFYVDPPYYETDAALGIGFTPEQHRELKERLSRLEGMWLLTINDHPQVRHLYKEYNIERVITPKVVCPPKDAGFREYYAHLIISNIGKPSTSY